MKFKAASEPRQYDFISFEILYNSNVWMHSNQFAFLWVFAFFSLGRNCIAVVVEIFVLPNTLIKPCIISRVKFHSSKSSFH